LSFLHLPFLTSLPIEKTYSTIDRYGPGTFEVFQDFEEFDGGDGQMGVAGDGRNGLEKDKADFNTPQMAGGKAAEERKADKSKMRSARNAWGTFTGYAEKLKEQGMDTARAQQLENWANQREVQKKSRDMKYMTDEFDKVRENAEADWRTLAKFGVERNEVRYCNTYNHSIYLLGVVMTERCYLFGFISIMT